MNKKGNNQKVYGKILLLCFRSIPRITSTLTVFSNKIPSSDFINNSSALKWNENKNIEYRFDQSDPIRITSRICIMLLL